MIRVRIPLAILVLALGVLGTVPLIAHTRITTDLNWSEDVRPVLRRHCMRCHRAGGVAPDYVDLTVYGSDTHPGARAWARAIEEELLTGRMPPWQADVRFVSFRNGRVLSQEEIDTIIGWVRGGSPQGPRRNLPPPPEFDGDEWTLGEPDLVVEPPEEHVIAPGQTESSVTHRIPVELEEDTWITGFEFLPDNAGAVYRMAAYLHDPPDLPLQTIEVEVQKEFDPFADEDELEETRPRRMPRGPHFLGEWLRGDEPVLFPDAAGRKLHRGSTVELRIDYRRTDLEGGEEEIRDLSRLGLFLAAEDEEIDLLVESTRLAKDGWVVKGKSPRQTKASLVLNENVHLVGLNPHIGQLCKSLEVRAVYADGKAQTLLWIPEYDPHWPSSYVFEDPIAAPAGTRLEMTGTFQLARGDGRRRVIVGEGPDEEPFTLMVDYMLDDHLILASAQPEPRRPTPDPRGGMLGAGDFLPVGTPEDPRAAAHMDHTPLHGGQFFMAANFYHHLEGALPAPGQFRLYVYDDFKKPVDPRNFGGKVVFERFDEETGEFAEEEYELTHLPAGAQYMVAQLPEELPAEFYASVWLAGEPVRFDFYFEELSIEPVGTARSGRVHTHAERPPVVIPEKAEEVVAQILVRQRSLEELTAAEDWYALHNPAFDAKDLAEELLGKLEGLSARQRGQTKRAVSRTIQGALELDRAGDAADPPRVRRAFERFREGTSALAGIFLGGTN